MTRFLRALAWASISAAILVGGLYALGFGLVTLRAAGGVASQPNVQRAALAAVVTTLAREALLPHAALTFVAWLVLASRVPRVDASWRALAASLAACALLAFPIIGAFTFEAWTPGGAADVIGTAALLSAAVGLGLWLGRRLVPGLGLGCFGTPPR
jgi:hypothetical protein